MLRIRALERFDAPLLPHFLALAAHEEEIESVLANPNLTIYVADWGRAGDCGVIGEDEEAGMVVGIAWARFWTEEPRGFGWVDERTPEIVVAVAPAFQGQGMGAELVKTLRAQLAEVSLADSNGQTFSPLGVALSVRADSPAVRLYERLGFEKVEGSESVNRTGGVSFNMVAAL